MEEGGRFDLIVVGAGPAGYAACFRAAELGMKTALVERSARVGGVCLNVGCIPSKALLESSEYFDLIREGLGGHGVVVDGVKLDLAAMMARKEAVVADLEKGLRARLEGDGIRIVHGKARLLGSGTVRVTSGDGAGDVDLTAPHILLAAGSEPVQIPFLPFDGVRVLSSTEALSLKSVPERLAVIGAGAVGLELGSVWSRLGSRVTVIEMLPAVAVAMDGQVSRALERFLKAQEMEFRLGTRLAAAEVTDSGVRLDLEKGGKGESIECDAVLVAVGRRPSGRGLGLEDVGVAVDPRTGQVATDAAFQTNISGIYAVGDLVAGPMLAHKASAEGAAAVEHMAGRPGGVNYDTIPSIIYTSPEAAGVGLTEEQLKARGVHYRSGVFPMSGVGRARCSGDTRGFVKVLAQERSGRVLGVHMVGQRVSELMAECVVAMEFGATAEHLARIVHAHPTLSEGVMEAASAARKAG